VAGSIVFVGIAPHPPLLVPEVGGERIDRVLRSQHALEQFSDDLVAAAPDSLVLISPHSPLDPVHFTARGTAVLHGDFIEFAAPNVTLAFKNDLDLLETIRDETTRCGLSLKLLAGDPPLDHGALVPLYYLHEAGWSGPTVVLGFTFGTIDTHVRFGEAIRRAAQGSDKRVAVVASGDLSHRLIVGGPYHYEPTAHLFDEQIVSALANGDAGAVREIDPALTERAGECGYRSILIAIGAAGENLPDHRVLSYEGPYGVGYMVAVLLDQGPPDSPLTTP
jgi:MEMO1 family protein